MLALSIIVKRYIARDSEKCEILPPTALLPGRVSDGRRVLSDFGDSADGSRRIDRFYEPHGFEITNGGS